jgi:hypothetical protein
MNIAKKNDKKLEMMQPTLKLCKTNDKNKPETRTLPAYSVVILTSHGEDQNSGNNTNSYCI